MEWSHVEIDLDKIQTIEEVKAALKLILIASTNWDGLEKIEVSASVINKIPKLNSLIKEKNNE